jgi:hypothetical protein
VLCGQYPTRHTYHESEAMPIKQVTISQTIIVVATVQHVFLQNHQNIQLKSYYLLGCDTISQVVVY